jgi:hypothetical protein
MQSTSIGFKPVYLSLISASKRTRWIQPPGFLKPFSSALQGLLALTANLLSRACYVFLHTLPVILYLFRGPVLIRVNLKCTLFHLSIALHSRQPTHSHYTFTLPAIPPFSNFLIDTLVIFYFLTYLHLTTVSGICANTFSSGPATDFRADLNHILASKQAD